MHDQGPRESLPLFVAYPALRRTLPWLSLGHWPTPVKELRQFADECGLSSFWIKREDLSHPHGAGNKVRGLEFLLADTKRRGAKTILTMSSAGSHHICKTAWHAWQLGINMVAGVVDQPAQPYVAQNLLLGASIGARYVHANLLTLLPKLGVNYLRLLLADGRAPYCIAPGGTTPLSCVGHVNAAFELKEQVAAGHLPEPEYLYVAMGSLGTAAGLLLGCAMAGLKTTIVGVAVSYKWYATAGRTRRIARRTLRLIRKHDPSVPEIVLDPARIKVVSTALGPGYAQATEAATHWARMMHEAETLELDCTYTAKALHGAMDFIRQTGASDKVHLLWHTYHAAPQREDLLAWADKLPAGLRKYVR